MLAKWSPDEPFDAVLLDAPCSATGTLRRHPDIAWNKTPEDVAKLTAVQDRLLAAAMALVKPGGLLVYATCSLQPREGVERIEALLASGAPRNACRSSPMNCPTWPRRSRRQETCGPCPATGRRAAAWTVSSPPGCAACRDTAIPGSPLARAGESH